MFFVLPRRVYDKACCFAEVDVSRFLSVPLTIAELFRRDFLHVFQNVLETRDSNFCTAPCQGVPMRHFAVNIRFLVLAHANALPFFLLPPSMIS